MSATNSVEHYRQLFEFIASNILFHTLVFQTYFKTQGQTLYQNYLIFSSYAYLCQRFKLQESLFKTKLRNLTPLIERTVQKLRQLTVVMLVAAATQSVFVRLESS